MCHPFTFSFKLLLGAVLVASQSGCGVQNVFFHPDALVYSTPASLGLRYEAVKFASRDGTQLSGWFLPATVGAKSAKGTVIHYHGNAQNMTAHWRFVAWLPEQGYNVLVFDYRGYGASQGKPEVKGVFEDANSALDYARNRADVDPDRLLILGQSLGGTNAIAVVGSGNRLGVKAMVIDSTFYSYSAIAHDKMTGAGLLMDDTYSAARYIGRISPIPLLLLHGTADAVIPYQHSERLFNQAQEPKQRIIVPDGQHIDALTDRFGTVYQSKVLAFFEAALVQASR